MEKNELSQTKIEQLQRQPIIETTISKTKDGKWSTTRKCCQVLKALN